MFILGILFGATLTVAAKILYTDKFNKFCDSVEHFVRGFE